MPYLRGHGTIARGPGSGPGLPEQAADVRRARFGTLPERVAFEDMVEEKAVLSVRQSVGAHDPDRLAVRFSCLAADFGL